MSTALTTTQHDPLSAIALAGHLADSTKKQYTKALEGYLDTGASLTDARALASYSQTLSKSRRAFLKSAVRLWAEEARKAFKGQATPGNVAQVQAALYRLEALEDAIEAPIQKGQRAHIWLSQAEVKGLLDTCGNDVQGQRDRLLLGLLVAAGLRRGEAAKLRFEDVKLVPRGDRFRTVLAIEGKGAKDRAVPISDNLANAIDTWAGVVGGQGRILRSLAKGGHVGARMSPVAIYNTVRQHGVAIGKPALAPHDLRRTFAQLGYEAGVPITQLSKLLGHSNVTTTQRYLNLDLDIETTASDFIPF